MSDYSIAIGINPKYAVAYFNRGCAKSDLQDYQGAIGDFNASIEIDPKYVEAYSFRGILKSYCLKNHKEAIVDFNIAIEIDPNYALAYYNRGLTRLQLGQRDSACNDFHKALKIGHLQAAKMIKENCK